MQLELESVLRDYTKSKQRLLVLGYNATLTTAVEAPRQPKRHFDQIQVVPATRLCAWYHPDLPVHAAQASECRASSYKDLVNIAGD